MVLTVVSYKHMLASNVKSCWFTQFFLSFQTKYSYELSTAVHHLHSLVSILSYMHAPSSAECNIMWPMKFSSSLAM